MPVEFYHLAPVILTGELFERYQPELTFEPQSAQLDGAFLIAEQKMVEGLQTPLLPVQVSGTFTFPYPYDTIMLPHVYVHSLDSIVAYGYEGGCNCDVTDLSACGRLRNHIGWIDTRIIAGHYVRACGSAVRPEYYDLAYTAGLPTGTAANDARLHMSLSMLTRIELLEMNDPGALEGGAGDAGVQSYSTVGYSESRTEQSVKPTPFGNSAMANKAWNLISHLRIMRPLRFGK
jgi:hypothetical protein